MYVLNDYWGQMDSFVPLRDRNALNQPKKNLHRTISTQVDEVYWNRMRCEEKKAAAVDEEIPRFNKLPPNTSHSHANYPLWVLHKVRSLLPLQSTISDDEELELLFAGLSV